MRRALVGGFVMLAVGGCARHQPVATTRDAPAPSVAPAPPPIAAEAPAPVADAAPVAPARPRLYIRTRSLPVHPDPSLRQGPIGALAAGDSVALRDEPPRATTGCASVRAIEPRGWVCADGGNATVDPEDAVWKALGQHAPDYASPLPFHYGESRGTRRQRALPDASNPGWPASLFEPRLEIDARSTVAWTDEVASGGQAWLRTSDMSFVRKEDVVPFVQTEFHGVALGGDVRLPIAFFKRVPHTQYRRSVGGHFAATGELWPRLGWVALSGKSEKRGGLTFWETRDGLLWLDARDAAVVGTEEPPPHGPRSTTIEVAALHGWLIAYAGDTPVYATLISAGKRGAVAPNLAGEPHQPPATTPLGTYRIREKLVTATLQSELDGGTDFVHAEVPWSQRFLDIYLLHSAYWHDQWGEGHSGGCVNLSPVDARWLFEWTEPKVPEGWHSLRVRDSEPATVVIIHP